MHAALQLLGLLGLILGFVLLGVAGALIVGGAGCLAAGVVLESKRASVKAGDR